MKLSVALRRVKAALSSQVQLCKTHVRSYRGYLSRSVIVTLVCVGAGLIVFQVWAHLELSRRAVDTSEAITHRHIATLFAERLRRFSEHASKGEVYRQINELARLNPAVRVYLLDEYGIVKASPKEYGRIAMPFVDLRPIKRFLALGEETAVVYGEDPSALRVERPISVEQLRLGGGTHYLYVVLAEGGAHATIDSVFGSTVGVGALVIATTSIGVIVLLVLAIAYRRLYKLQGSVAALSHDLRSPLSSIQGYLETLLNKGEALNGESSQRFMKIALRSTQSAASLVDDLHHLSRFEAAGERPRMEAFSLSDLVMDLEMSLQQQLREKEISFSVDVPAVLPLAYGNIQLVERLLRNLLQNALRYTPQRGKIELTVQLVATKTRVTVLDSGCGILESEMTKVKGPFFRGTNVSSSVQGSGIGLSIASAVARLHGSELKILSREGEGTAAVFELPHAPSARRKVA